MQFKQKPDRRPAGCSARTAAVLRRGRRLLLAAGLAAVAMLVACDRELPEAHDVTPGRAGGEPATAATLSSSAAGAGSSAVLPEVVVTARRPGSMLPEVLVVAARQSPVAAQ
jgi:hypothetical protein